MQKISSPVKTVFKLMLAFCFFNQIATAQKLPNKQEVSFRAPANIKIDGKTTEWGNKFQAHNDATGVSYTMANDDENLYLVMQTNDLSITDKIVSGGVTLTIQKMGKSNSTGAIYITYPTGTPLAFNNMRDRADRRDTSAKTVDSLMRNYNIKLGQQCKQISIVGVKGLDTLMSVYNEQGIKAACLFSRKYIYAIELSVPLKHLGLSAVDGAHFAYHLKLNGKNLLATKTDMNSISMNDTGLPPGPEINKTELQAVLDKLEARTGATAGPTDFWADYTLAKKP